MQSDIATLKEKIEQTARTSPVWPSVREIAIEADQDNEGWEFLRVEVHLDQAGRDDLDSLRVLKRAIVDAVEPLDERFPSVRFPDAA